MKIKMLFVALIMMIGTLSYAQSLDSIVNIVTHPPKVSNYSTVTEAFSKIETYVAAFFVFLFSYVAQWIPGLAKLLSYAKPYLRAITIGIAVLWTLISWGKIQDSQASFSFILSNLLYILMSVFKILPTTPAQLLAEKRKDALNLSS